MRLVSSCHRCTALALNGAGFLRHVYDQFWKTWLRRTNMFREPALIAEVVMKKSERRVAIALVGVAIWLAGLYATITGLLYDRQPEFRYGVLAVFLGIAIAVIALNLISVPGLSSKKKPVSR
ncbi:hypothetical protein ABIE53_005796 [Burkholderia sp. OAS925]|nr:DUF2964 family protein [Paraburkholderia graminis]MDQ0625206.1 hypothetical protein [Paraburkholderia graminis]MDR6206362.1 hypothetical protein [Paraburkholderia graminis]MDR6475907.1 hypothetical protein [Paraburkholderia graminis]